MDLIVQTDFKNIKKKYRVHVRVNARAVYGRTVFYIFQDKRNGQWIAHLSGDVCVCARHVVATRKKKEDGEER